MVVITLEKSPLALRGDLTKWLQEISMGVYVGQVSARVRDRLWERVCKECKSGRATMVYSVRNEQRYDFRIHNTTWEPIDFDGLKLMMRPSSARTKSLGKKRLGWSEASRFSKKKGRKPNRDFELPSEYVVVDIETTGLNPNKDEIIELAAIRVRGGRETDAFQCLVHCGGGLSDAIAKLTGLSHSRLMAEGLILENALTNFLEFVSDDLIVAHNAEFDIGFIQSACEELDWDDFDNDYLDTLALARKKLPQISDHRLSSLAERLHLENRQPHRALSDCRLTHCLLAKLNEN